MPIDPQQAMLFAAALNKQGTNPLNGNFGLPQADPSSDPIALARKAKEEALKNLMNKFQTGVSNGS